jgi:hypothetical protein
MADLSEEIRRLPAQDERVETGPVQFGDDWPGLFIRGDDCLALFFSLCNVEVSGDDPVAVYQVKEVLAELLHSPLQHPNPTPEDIEWAVLSAAAFNDLERPC